jgi:hypothetical protein
VLNFDKVDIDQLFYKFDNFGQDYLLSENLHGKLTAIIKSKVRMHADLTPYLEESTAHIEATIKDGEILDYAPFHAMAEYFGDKDLDKVRFGELVNTFDVKDGILSIPSMTINSTLGFMDITGTQSAKDDMKMDYTMRVPLKVIKKATFSKIFNKDKKEGAGKDEIIEDEGKGLRMNVRITGTPDDYKIKLGKKKEK